MSRSTLTPQEGLDLLWSNPEGVVAAWLEILDETPEERQRGDGSYGFGDCLCAVGLLSDCLGIDPMDREQDEAEHALLELLSLDAWAVSDRNDDWSAPDASTPYHRASTEIRRQLAEAGGAL